MTRRNDLTTQPTRSGSIGKRALIGGGIALGFIILFLAGVDEPDPDWPKFWMIRPLLIVPAAGALGGVCVHIMTQLRDQFGWNKILVFIANVIGYLIALWLGTVLGLDGTLWN